MVNKSDDELKPDMILKMLRKHLKEQRPVTLYNTFHGVPITYEAEVAMIHTDYAGLIVHPYQAVCIQRERRTYLQSRILPSLVRAYPVSIDYTNNVVLLKQFQYPKSISVDLFNSWVAPEKQVKLEASSDERDDFLTKMQEIAALDENRIRVAFEVPEDIAYNREDAIELAFRLEPGGDLLQVPGVVSSLTKVRNKDRKRMEVEGVASMADEISILAYIAKREDQIIAALDKAYQRLRKGKKARKK
jgi:hypothetical protein